jgi:hypothetical protein
MHIEKNDAWIRQRARISDARSRIRCALRARGDETNASQRIADTLRMRLSLMRDAWCAKRMRSR